MTHDITAQRTSYPAPPQDSLEQAGKYLGEPEAIVLSGQDFERFVAILQDSAPPTPTLVRAMREYETLRVAHPDRGL